MTRRIVSVTAATALVVVFAGVSCGKKLSSTAQQLWTPGISFPTPTKAVYRGLTEKRGLIHAHNIHSHDACDNAPRTLPDGSPVPDGYTGPTIGNQACFKDFQDGICQANIDYVFLTDHGASFDDTEFPDATAPDNTPMFVEGDNTMLNTPSRGDRIIQRNGHPVANVMTCPKGGDNAGHQTLLMPGNEGNNLMSVGVEQHVSADPNTRGNFYGVNTERPPHSNSPVVDADVNAAIDAIHAVNGVVLMAHPEDMNKEDFAHFPIDGFEMYNLHANVLFTNYGLGGAATLIAQLGADPKSAVLPPNANTAILAIVNEDPRYLLDWGYTLSQGVKRVMTMGSDCHRNALPQLLPWSVGDPMDPKTGKVPIDPATGLPARVERIDSYRRVMEWFSNHLLIKTNADGSWDDSNLKEALKAGRLFGVFEALGYPQGFDFHATAGGAISEMGDEVTLSKAPTFSVKMPTVQNLDPKATTPALTIRILKAADNDTGWIEVANGTKDLSFTPTEPGAYRAEVRIVPNHLKDAVGPYASTWLAHDYVWIYGNAIYVH